MSEIHHRVLNLIHNDTLVISVINITSLLSFCYIYLSIWIDSWPGTFMLISLSIYSLYTVHRNINTYIAKFARVMIGILITMLISFISGLYFSSYKAYIRQPILSMEYKDISIISVTFIIVYKVKKILFSNITVGCFILAGIIDLYLITFLLNRSAIPFGPGSGRASHMTEPGDVKFPPLWYFFMDEELKRKYGSLY
jgi:hypothetical protein